MPANYTSNFAFEDRTRNEKEQQSKEIDNLFSNYKKQLMPNTFDNRFVSTFYNRYDKVTPQETIDLKKRYIPKRIEA